MMNMSAAAGPSDHDLLRRFVETRCERAFGELVRRHTSLVYATALRVLGDRQLAEDTLQVVFAALATRARKLLAGNSVSGWLYKTAHLSALNLARNRTRRKRGETMLATVRGTRAPEPCSTTLEHEELRHHLDSALAELPAVQRNAIVVRLMLERSPTEAARELRCSEKALSMRLHRAMEALRGKLRKQKIELSGANLLAILHSETMVSAPAAAIEKACALHQQLGAPQGVLGSLKSVLRCKATTLAGSLLAAYAVLMAIALPYLFNNVERVLEDEFGWGSKPKTKRAR